jgi:glutamate N-acetyltransferase/amino-acid N-acetyltransferase
MNKEMNTNINSSSNDDSLVMMGPSNGEITMPKGFRASGITCGIKQSGKKDMALIVSDHPASVAAVFTTNKMAAAPVLLSRKHVANGVARAIVVNSGNANACTGDQGMKDAQSMAELTAKALGIEVDEVIVASTGIIGVPMPMDVVTEGIRTAVKSLASNVKNGADAAEAILTTDTFKKEVGLAIEVRDAVDSSKASLAHRSTIKIGGMAKGSGMIEPNMATMLAFITTDAEVDPGMLHHMLKKAVEVSFNSITVDGDTSTNDMVTVLANGASGVKITKKNEPFFQKALEMACIELAQLIVRDGEGATKLIEIEVTGAKSNLDAKKAAKAIANSNLVKTAFFGQDANWGRVVCAAGYSSADVDANKIDVYYGDQKLVENGQPIKVDAEKIGSILKQTDIKVLVDLKLGEGNATVWTCDFSYDYVKINAEYHT